MKEEIIELVILYCDYTSSINITIKYHYLRGLVQDKEVKMEYVNKKGKISNIFKKALPKDAHDYLGGKLGVIPL